MGSRSQYPLTEVLLWAVRGSQYPVTEILLWAVALGIL